jgi:hypothetical protein
MRRGMAVAVGCVGIALAAPGGAMALSTHSATSSTPNGNGVLVATAKCGAHERVVSGGFRSPESSSAIVSRAVRGDSWTVHLYPESGPLTTFAYCARKGQFSISSHVQTVSVMVRGANTSATASCGSGEKVVSGGYVMSPVSATHKNSPNFRDFAAGPSKWTVMSAFALAPAKLAAVAYCARGVTVKVRSESTSIAAQGFGDPPGTGSATASCHKGETLLAGGYTTTPTPDYDDMTGPDLFYNASHRTAIRSWTASASNYSAAAGKLTAFAYCEP